MKKRKVGTISTIIKKAAEKLILHTYLPFLFSFHSILFIKLINENIKALNECQLSVIVVIMTHTYIFSRILNKLETQKKSYLMEVPNSSIHFSFLPLPFFSQ